MSSKSSIEIVPLAAEHRQSVINLLMSSFFLQEPLNAVLKFETPQEPLARADHIIDGGLRDQCSLVAIDTATPHKDVVGVMFNSISSREQKEESHVTPSERIKFIFSLIDKVSEGHDLFELLKTDRLMHCDIINIDEKQRGKNLSTQMISTSLENARRSGIKGAFVVCTSLFSKKAFMHHGFHIVNEVLYADHSEGRLTNMGIHDRCTLLAKQL